LDNSRSQLFDSSQFYVLQLKLVGCRSQQLGTDLISKPLRWILLSWHRKRNFSLHRRKQQLLIQPQARPPLRHLEGLWAMWGLHCQKGVQLTHDQYRHLRMPLLTVHGIMRQLARGVQMMRRMFDSRTHSCMLLTRSVHLKAVKWHACWYMTLMILPSTLQAHRNEIGRLTKHIESLQSQHQNCTESVACIQRHWLMLIDELKRTFQRLERTKSTMDHTIVNDTLQAFFQNQVMALEPLERS
jgi:hypothetical protein